KGDDSFFVIFYVLVKAIYPYQNQFLNHASGNDIVGNLSVDIAELNDYDVANIKTSENKYLFSIKKSDELNGKASVSDIEIILWFCGFLSLFLLINSIFQYYAEKGSPILASIGLTLSFFLIRYLCLKYHFPE